MLHCIRSECELKQALMCCGTLFLSYMVEYYTLRASWLFEEQWGTEPESAAKWGGCSWVQSGRERPSLLIIFWSVAERLNNMHEPQQWTEVSSEVTVHAFCQFARRVQNEPTLTALRKSVCVCMFMCVWLVLRVKWPEIIKGGRTFSFL